MLLLEDNLLTKAIDPNCLAKASTWTGNDCMWVTEGNRGTGSFLVKFRAWVCLSPWSSVGGVLMAWPWCHLGFTCRACPSRSLLSGHQLSGATLQTLLWGLQESSRIWNPSAKAKGRCEVQFQLHIGVTMELFKKITTLVLGFLCHAGCYWNNWQKSQSRRRWNSTLVSILNFSNCSVVWMGIPWEICMSS